MKQVRIDMLRSLLHMKRSQIEAALLEGNFVEVMNHITPLAQAFRTVGPREVTANASRKSSLGMRFLRYANNVQSFIENAQAEGQQVVPKERYVMQGAFSRICIIAEDFLSKVAVTEDDYSERSSGNEAEEKLNLDEVRKQLTQYDAKRHDLEKDIIKFGYSMRKVPLVLDAEPMLRRAELSKYFNCGTFEGYTVLREQIVMGMSSTLIDKQSNPDYERPSDAPRKGRLVNRHKFSSADVFKQMLDSLNAKHANGRYIVVGQPKAWLSRDALEKTSWVWVMTSKDFDLLRRCSVSPGTLRIKSWQMAFSS